MDKNTVIGMLLIGLIILGFSIFNKSTPEPTIPTATTDTVAANENIVQNSTALLDADSTTRMTTVGAALGSMAHLSEGIDVLIKMKNEKLSLLVSTKGGMPTEAQLLGYKTYQGDPLYLFRSSDIRWNIPLLTVENRMVNTADLYFTPIQNTDSTLVMRLAVDSATYLDLTYKLPANDYRLAMSISGANLDRILPANMTRMNLEWMQRLPQQELSWRFENQYSSIFYKYSADNVKELGAGSNEKESINEPLRWIGNKAKFFSTVLVVNEGAFEDSKLETKILGERSGYTKECSTTTSFAFDTKPNTRTDFTLFVGPNDFSLLDGYDKGVAKEQQLQMDKLVDLGSSVFRWINRWLILPTVDFLSGFISNWGIIILLLTVVIKLILSPLTFKSYMSQAKMRVLRPQVEAINAKYPGKDNENMMKRNQETMALYKSAGASPMSGCLPMLMQMPFLIALYMFFPSSILLRGESFLWAQDLSTYDPIISWTANIPIVSSFYGNHVSLFCLLWAVTNIFYSRYTMGQSATGQQAMPGMKWMPYIMTIMFLFYFNSNSSGLCYYYFISTLITILQYVGFRYMINEEKLLAKMEENKKRPQKKSKWAARLEEMQKQQQAAQRQQRKNTRR